MFVLGRQDQGLAEVIERLIDVEADIATGDLEEHAGRLTEVHGVEVLAVDDGGWARPVLVGPFAELRQFRVIGG